MLELALLARTEWQAFRVEAAVTPQEAFQVEVAVMLEAVQAEVAFMVEAVQAEVAFMVEALATLEEAEAMLVEVEAEDTLVVVAVTTEH
jgi:hypothetical protein